MFHRPSLLMTGIVLMMAVGWFALQHFDVDARAAAAEQPAPTLALDGDRDIAAR